MEVQKKIQNGRFLVTGGCGFIGSHLVETLLNNNAKKVVVLDNLSTGFIENISFANEFSQFQFIKGDIRNLDDCLKATKEVDFVLHQAALGSVPRSIEDPITTNQVNIGGHLNVLVAAKDSNVKRVVYAASSSTYGDSKELPKIESRIGKPLSPYAITKYVNELYADVFYNIYGLETIGLRYFNVYGPRQNPNGPYAAVIPLFMRGVKFGDPVYINGDGTQTRDFTYVDNVVNANLCALFSENELSVNQVYNIAVGERISLNELFAMINALKPLSNCKPIYRQARQGDVKDSLADISKATSLINYIPKVKISEGIKMTFDFF